RAAVEALLAAVSTGNFFRTFPAIDVLGRSGDPRAVQPLAALLDNRHYALEAARALGRTGDKNAVGPLARRLTEPTIADVRVAAACAALARIGNPAVAEPLFARLEDGSALVVQAAIAAIQSLGSPQTQTLALAAALAPSPRSRRWGLRILAYFGYGGGLDAILA